MRGCWGSAGIVPSKEVVHQLDAGLWIGGASSSARGGVVGSLWLGKGAGGAEGRGGGPWRRNSFQQVVACIAACRSADLSA